MYLIALELFRISIYPRIDRKYIEIYLSIYIYMYKFPVQSNLAYVQIVRLNRADRLSDTMHL